jgi:hypothetical protein
MGQADRTFYQRYVESNEDFKTGNSKSNLSRHLTENNFSTDRIENIIKVVRVNWKGSHVNT